MGEIGNLADYAADDRCFKQDNWNDNLNQFYKTNNWNGTQYQFYRPTEMVH